MAKLQRATKTLKKTAEENLNVTKVHEDGSREEVKKGAMADEVAKHSLVSSQNKVGIAKGVTKNMGNFESLRVDVWLTQDCTDLEDAQTKYKEMEEAVDSLLEETVMQYVDEED